MKRFSASDLILPPFVESPRPQLHPGHAFPDFPGWLSTTAWVGQHFLFSYEDYIMAFFPCCPAVALVCARWPSQSQYFEPKLQIPKCGKSCGCFFKELSILCEDFFFFNFQNLIFTMRKCKPLNSLYWEALESPLVSQARKTMWRPLFSWRWRQQ